MNHLNPVWVTSLRFITENDPSQNYFRYKAIPSIVTYHFDRFRLDLKSRHTSMFDEESINHIQEKKLSWGNSCKTRLYLKIVTFFDLQLSLYT